MIRQYKKGVAEKVSEEFDSTDFDCRCTRPECEWTTLDDRMVAGATKLALYFAILIIDSGFRCPAHNKEVGGKPDSQHLLGKAADIRSRFATPKEIKDKAETIADFENGGIGLYAQFVHCDVRNGKARW